MPLPLSSENAMQKTLAAYQQNLGKSAKIVRKTENRFFVFRKILKKRISTREKNSKHIIASG